MDQFTTFQQFNVHEEALELANLLESMVLHTDWKPERKNSTLRLSSTGNAGSW